MTKNVNVNANDRLSFSKGESPVVNSLRAGQSTPSRSWEEDERVFSS